MNHLLVYVIVILLIVCIIISASANKYKKTIKRNEKKAKDISSRRKISKSDRQYVLERDNYTCQICGISKDFVDSLCYGLGDYLLFEIDHIQSVANGGTGADVDNLQCLCWRCNRKKGGRKTNKETAKYIDYGIKYLKK